jgi:hypothetical protein
MLFYDVSLSYLEKSCDFVDRNIFERLKAVDLKDVNCSKFEQAITALNFSNICAAFDFDVFMSNSVSEKIYL